MTQKVKRFKQGGGATKSSSGRGSEPIQNLDYNLLSGSGTGGGGGGGGGGFRVSPTMINTPSSYMGSMAGAPPKAVGINLKKRFKKGGKVKKMAKGGSVSASRRGDGIARKGKTRGKVC